MIDIVGVSFTNDSKINYFEIDNLEINNNTNVIVSNTKGILFGTVVKTKFKDNKSKLTDKKGKVIRIATKKDYIKFKKNQEEADLAIKTCNDLILKHKLNMKLLDASYSFDKTQLLFRFISDNRVDFRLLAKDLASSYKTRIELRQIGVRDKAKEIGGYGSCGQKLCCSRFESDFSAVSINMAKNQNISLNPSKINGVCGRLLCCLKYEDEIYKDCRKCLPKFGAIIETEKGSGKVINVDILAKKYKVSVKGEIIDIEVKCGSIK